MRMGKRRMRLGCLSGCLVAFAVIALSAGAQTTAPNEWTWMGGSSRTAGPPGGQPGVYGTLGVFAPGNIPNGRWASVSWIDDKGNFWLFGGVGSTVDDDGLKYNDLWEFNPSTNEWAWMAGSNTGSQSGVYGTLGIPSAENVPGGREDASGWTDNEGNLWLFGGYGADANGANGILNDLWEFNPSTNEWALMGGNIQSVCGVYCSSNPGAVYGALGTPAPGDHPGAQVAPAGWTDNNGNFWIFGGDPTPADEGGFIYYNTLWEYHSVNRRLAYNHPANLQCACRGLFRNPDRYD